MIRFAFLICIVAGSAGAQSVGHFECAGLFPDWSLTLEGDAGRLNFDGVSVDVEIPQFSRAEARDTPVAATLLNEEAFVTGIILLDHAECVSGGQLHPMRGHLLTQRGNLPILLTGCCEPLR